MVIFGNLNLVYKMSTSYLSSVSHFVFNVSITFQYAFRIIRVRAFKIMRHDTHRYDDVFKSGSTMINFQIRDFTTRHETATQHMTIYKFRLYIYTSFLTCRSSIFMCLLFSYSFNDLLSSVSFRRSPVRHNIRVPLSPLTIHIRLA